MAFGWASWVWLTASDAVSIAGFFLILQTTSVQLKLFKPYSSVPEVGYTGGRAAYIVIVGFSCRSQDFIFSSSTIGYHRQDPITWSTHDIDPGSSLYHISITVGVAYTV
jgi:hypothetical protein